MLLYLKKNNGQIFARSSVSPLTPDELTNPDELQVRVEFTKQVTPI